VITDGRLRTLARQDGVTAGLAEKNYVNSWILYAIYNSPLKDALVFYDSFWEEYRNKVLNVCACKYMYR